MESIKKICKNKVALCVGATSGIGKAIALELAKQGASVTIMGRSEQVGKEIVSQLDEINPSGKHDMIVCDATSMKNIVKSVEIYKNKISTLNYLVLSQGIATTSGRDETSEGIDKKMALHYYGRILFIKELLDILRKTSIDEDVRVLNILSAGVHSPYSKLDDLDLKENYSLSNAANSCGFYNDLTMDSFSKDKDNSYITFIHAAPGFVKTAWGKELPGVLKFFTRCVQIFAMKPETCAQNMMKGLIGDKMKGGFHLMDEKGEEAKVTKFHNNSMREAVWDHTNDILIGALKEKNI